MCSKANGVEVIAFSDGVTTKVFDSPVATSTITGTTAATNHTGWNYRDLILADAGNDTVAGLDGDDTLVGGLGNDSLNGGNGSDQYLWSHSDGNDTISDTSASLTEIDRLIFSNVTSSEVSLFRAVGSNNLQITIAGVAGSEVITIIDRFANPSQGLGIETMEFSDGVKWNLDDILVATWAAAGTGAGNDSVTGTGYADNLYGLTGNDTLVAATGDDVLIGGLGADSLDGGAGNDQYRWSKGEGNDTLNDTGTSTAESDTLVLTNVASWEVSMTRVNGTNDINISIPGPSGTEIIRVVNRYGSTASGNGIEAITFSDGITWHLADILAKTVWNGTTGNDSLVGSNYADYVLSAAGNDTIIGGVGDDILVGGLGIDSLDGGLGNDAYEWNIGDGQDTINDTSSSLAEIDTLRLMNVLSTDVQLKRWTNTSNHMQIKVTTPGGIQSVIIANQLLDPALRYGVESIVFADGVIWSLDDMFARISTTGSAGNDNIIGTGYDDRIWGSGGNDTLNGGLGDDKLTGGSGADLLIGGVGVDIACYDSGATQGVRVDLAVTTSQIGNAGGHEVGDVLQGIENLQGSAFADQLWGDNSSNVIKGLTGNDVIYGRDGFDQIFGGSGADTIYGGDGADNIQGEFNSDVLYGEAGMDTIDGGDWNDQIFGGTDDDMLNGGLMNDTISGDAGADIIRFTDVSFGNDVVMGYEDGLDHLSFGLNVADNINDFTITGNGTSSVTVMLGANSVIVNGAGPITLLADDFLFN